MTKDMWIPGISPALSPAPTTFTLYCPLYFLRMFSRIQSICSRTRSSTIWSIVASAAYIVHQQFRLVDITPPRAPRVPATYCAISIHDRLLVDRASRRRGRLPALAVLFLPVSGVDVHRKIGGCRGSPDDAFATLEVWRGASDKRSWQGNEQ